MCERSFELWADMVCKASFADDIASDRDGYAVLKFQTEAAWELINFAGHDVRG